jgi:protein-tyrosine-phosphatase
VVHVLAVLKERDVPTDGLVPKGLEAFEGQSFDYVITLSDPAREQAPSFPGANVSIGPSSIRSGA